MKHLLLFLLPCCTASISLYGQNKPVIPGPTVPSEAAKKSAPLEAYAFDLSPVSADLDWMPALSGKPRMAPERSKDYEKLEAIKAEKQGIKSARLQKNFFEPESESAITPLLARNFSGNANNGSSPLDNSIAVSNGGWIVSVINTNIQYYNVNGQRTFTNTIENFFNFAGIEDVCDPLVLYDSEADRFIFFAQECSGDPKNSHLLISFSKSNNPAQGWWLYKLSGNPRNNNTWFDYPKMAVTTNELLISGNSYNGEDFEEALLFQIQKAGGYSGGKLVYQYWYSMPGNPHTVLPLGYALSGSYGPGAYLVATETEGADYIHFYDLTNDMSASDEALNYYKLPTAPYSPVANAAQKGTSRLLDNGDCRALSGFYLDTTVHVVFHTDPENNSWNGINYLRINVLTRKISSSTFGLAGSYDYSYPAIASLSTGNNDKSVMIGFCRSSENSYPEIRVVACDHTMSWSSSALVKAGVNYVDYSSSNSKDSERWGDYTGMARWLGAATPTVWMSAAYGAGNNEWSTWIAEVKRVNSATPSDATSIPEGSFKLYPNPGQDLFRTEFTLDEALPLRIVLYNAQGASVKTLFEGHAQAGENVFSFNRSNLPSGTYVLSVYARSALMKSVKLVVGGE